MKIGIIGAGFTGLSAAHYLSKKGHEVLVFEKDSKPGGLAIGYKEKGWSWTLESHYHHWFTNDKFVLELAREIAHPVEIKRPKTSNFVEDEIYQLDSPTALLKFPKLSIADKIRMGASLAVLRYNPFWKPLENYKAEEYLRKTMGKKGYNLLWQPLMKNKLGKYADEVSLAWFWARIYKRTPSLAYPEQGFLRFAERIQKSSEDLGAKFFYSKEIRELKSENIPTIKFDDESEEFDKVIVTLPLSFFIKIAQNLPTEYTYNAGKFLGIGATNLILRLKNQFMRDGTYWLSMSDINSKVLAIVEHTNFIDKKHYNNEHIVYLGNYTETSDEKYKMEEDELFNLYDPWLRKINPDYRKDIIDYRLFKAPFAQPIITPGYSTKIPKHITPLKNVYLANIQQVYPWDRGTNYSVELGKKMLEVINE